MDMPRVRPDLACFVYALMTLALVSLAANAQPADYEFTALETTTGVPLSSFNSTYSRPTINNSGVVAYRVRVATFTFNLVLNDGSSTTIIDLNAAAGFGALFDPTGPVINDADAVAVAVTQFSPSQTTPGSILRIEPGDSVIILATTHGNGASGDFKSVQGLAMNNAGQVALLVVENSDQFAIALVDDSAQPVITVIDTQDITQRFNFSRPAINDAGVVAYKARVISSVDSVFTGDGNSAVLSALPLPSGVNCGVTSAHPDINNNGLIAGQHPNCLYVGFGGVVTDIIVDDTTSPFNSSIGRLGLNDRDQVVFEVSTNNASGLYFGDDPVNDKLIDVGDMLFGEVVSEVRFVGEGGFNNQGQVVFLASTVSDSNVTSSYLIRADLKDVPDIDVSPTAVNFGDVELGSVSPAIVTISNAGDADLTVNTISLQSGADYAITIAPMLPAVIAANGDEDVTITFTPVSVGVRPTDTLKITSDDPDEALVSVPLDGTGVPVTIPPSEQIADILTVIEDGLTDGDIKPEGEGKSGSGRLGAFINMIGAAGDLVTGGQIAEACQQLLDAYRKTDGLSGRGEPPDFISGPDAQVVAGLIQDLRTDLGCP